MLASGSLRNGRFAHFLSATSHAQCTHSNDVGWLRKRLNLNFFLGLFSLGTCALLWQFARPLGIPLLSNLPPITEVITASKQLLLSQSLLGRLDAQCASHHHGLLVGADRSVCPLA